jgi:aspartyl-tRNA(Asn)/glutamyl-tRNA(Gln) amidotransferase subunit A
MGPHPADPYSLPTPAKPYLECIDELPERLKIAFSPDLGYAVVQKEVMACVEKAVKAFEGMGHQVELWPGTLPDTGEFWGDIVAIDIYAQLNGVLEKERDQIGRTLVSVLENTRKMTVEQLTVIQQRRAELNAGLETLFDEFDLLITPTMPTEAFAAKGPPPSEIDGTPIPLLGAVAFTYPFNFSGHPAASVPAGLTPNRLPAGLQIIAPRHQDSLVLQAAYAYEKAMPWDNQWPSL